MIANDLAIVGIWRSTKEQQDLQFHRVDIIVSPYTLKTNMSNWA
jgi:hypothetical protein